MPKLLILTSALLLALNLSAATERHALVIGNANYQSSPLRNPLNDARDMAAALEGLGFEVHSLLDADVSSMEQAILDFGDRLRDGGVGLFYYAGHGVQAQGSNYLIPLQANISREIQLKRKAIDAGLVLDAMGAANNGLNIVILDACRDNPYENSFRNTTRGLARMDSPKGSLIAYATAPGDVAADGDGRNGVFTKHLLEQMQKPGVQVEQVFKQVTQAVHAETRQRQTPFMTSSLLGDFYFKPASAAASATTPAPKPAPTPAPTTQTTRTIDGLSLDDWLLVYGDNAITIASLDKVVAYERQHGGNAASRSYINRGLQVALANVNSADDLLEYQSKFGYLPGAPAQIEARLAELLANGASRQDLIRLRGQFPASATLRLQLAGAYHQAKLFDAAAGEYQSWLGLTDSSHPQRKQVLEALVAAREGRLPQVFAVPQAELIKLLGSTHSDYTKLDARGNKLPSSARSWACVLDNRSGLIWEVKTDDGGARDKDNKYRWGGKGVRDVALGRYEGNNQRLESRWDGSGDRYDDWNKLITAANSEQLCGFSDWRVPDLYQLASLVRCRGGSYQNLDAGCDGSYQRPTIDTKYFPNAQSGRYWSASPYAYGSSSAWQLSFFSGYGYGNYRDYNSHVRLVRSGQ